jgi:hypothetical protein
MLPFIFAFVLFLRNNMFELADRLVGIYKTFDMTKSVTINPKRFIGPASSVEDDNNTTSVEKVSKGMKGEPLSDATNRLVVK